MLKVFTQVDEGKVSYFIKTENGEKSISQQEYMDESLRYADEIYQDVVELAKKNGCVYANWIQRHFNVNWYSASRIIEKMREEQLCGEHDSEFGASKMLVS